jgi:alkanesulfonate monooxygenase SsuD/methylene tetrahydromethanopterin reductase-like flavin-dependent oxidoreductase (luciferase family)
LGKLKFGVFLPFYAYQTKTATEQFQTLKTIVLDCDRYGYDSIWLDDHLMYGNCSILEPWITLSALSTLTSRIRLGTMVSCNAHRNPAVLAKSAATLDVLSNGRLEFGIGAGCQETEHLAYGFGFPRPSVRIAQLGEAIEVIKRLWIQKKANFQGKHYSLKNAVCKPKPIQKPYPPITVGGNGEKLLEVTAKYADRFDWGALPSKEDYEHKLEVLENHCRVVGRDFGEIERSAWPSGQILIAEDQTALAKKAEKFKPSNVGLQDYLKGTLAITADQCRDPLQAYTDLGVTYFMLYFADLPSSDGLKLFAEAVANKF